MLIFLILDDIGCSVCMIFIDTYMHISIIIAIQRRHDHLMIK